MLKGARKTLRRGLARALHGIGRRDFREALERAGVRRGQTICVHSALTELGYFAGGPPMILDCLKEAVGPEGTLLMPTFPTRGAAAKYLDGEPVFDVRHTPSAVGALTEYFRQSPGVLRSLHPTNPVAAWGPRAEYYIAGHERSLTPYGKETPFGRLSRQDDAHILMLSTPPLSVLHHLQERVDFPNLFLPETRTADCIDADGQAQRVELKVMRPRVPYFVAVPGTDPDTPDWAILHDYALVFPGKREPMLRAAGYTFPGFPELEERRSRFEAEDILQTARLGQSEIGLLAVKRFFEAMVPEMKSLVDRYRPHYDLENRYWEGLEYF